jgi:hypothetical protein
MGACGPFFFPEFGYLRYNFLNLTQLATNFLSIEAGVREFAPQLVSFKFQKAGYAEATPGNRGFRRTFT